jgi:hypothetical protein
LLFLFGDGFTLDSMIYKIQNAEILVELRKKWFSAACFA